jgi:hypothetical protein
MGTRLRPATADCFGTIIPTTRIDELCPNPGNIFVTAAPDSILLKYIRTKSLTSESVLCYKTRTLHN